MPFESAHQKEQRGKVHAESAFALMRRITNSERKPVRFLETTPGTFVAELTEELDRDLPLVLGDAFHNFASALDHATCELYRLENREEPGRRVQFPRWRCWDAERADRLREERKAELEREGFRPESAKFLIGFGAHPPPYSEAERLGGYLYNVIKADIDDKHKFLIPSVALGIIWPQEVREGVGGYGPIQFAEFDEQGRLPLVRCMPNGMPAGGRLGDLNIALRVEFPNRPDVPFAGQNVHTVLASPHIREALTAFDTHAHNMRLAPG